MMPTVRADDGEDEPQRRETHALLAVVLETALHAGELLLRWGADTRRVEETVQRLGTALGAEALEVFVTPTGIVATALKAGEHRTRVQRVAALGFDLTRLDAVNRLSRQAVAERWELAAVRIELARINALPRYPLPWLLLSGLAATGAFAALFGGDWQAVLLTMFASLWGIVTHYWLVRRMIAPVLVVPFVTFLTTVISVPLCAAWGVDPASVVPAAVIMLVPGVPLVNAGIDLLAGDVLSGVARAATAVLVAAEIAVGVAVGVAVWR